MVNQSRPTKKKRKSGYVKVSRNLFETKELYRLKKSEERRACRRHRRVHDNRDVHGEARPSHG
jgi:hypothetical protein